MRLRLPNCCTPFPLWAHVLLLCVFVAGVFLVWMIPVLVMNGPWEVPHLLLARNFAQSGLFSFHDSLGRFLAPSELPVLGVPSAIDGRLSAMAYAFLSRWIAWGSLSSWVAVSAGITACGLFPLWDAVRRYSTVRTAWLTVFLYAFFPFIWQRSLIVDNYPLAYFFLFAAFDIFAILFTRRILLACLLAGICMGLSFAAKDVFLLFLPWILISFLWFYRSKKRTAFIGVVIFVVAAGMMYALPYINDIGTYGYPVNQNLARIWPGAAEIANESYLHLYPDPYTYSFDRETFDATVLAEAEQMSLIERIQYQKLFLNYGLKTGFIARMLNGGWLLLNHLPGLFQLSTLGGPFLWGLFVYGAVLLWSSHRRIVIFLLGLLVIMYVELSFVLQYEREHGMDIAWIVAILGAVGLDAIATRVSSRMKRTSSCMVLIGITLLCLGHLLLVNRLEFARLYAKSSVPELSAVAMAFSSLPSDAVIVSDVHPNDIASLALLSDRTVVLLQSETVERLLASEEISAVLQLYGVTHAFGYSPMLLAKMQETSAVHIVVIPEVPPADTSAWLRYFLAIIR